MSRDDRTEVARLAEDYRPELPPEFFTFCDLVESALEHGEWPSLGPSRGGDAPFLSSAVIAAILEEIRLLLCTTNPRYTDIRRRGRSMLTAGIPAIAGYIAGVFGIPVASATGAVAFLVLAILRVGVAVFCRISAPNAQTHGCSTQQLETGTPNP